MSKSQNILVVDDDADSATALSKLLELVGHTVQVAGNSADALAIAASDPVDLVLCDVGLPDSDGVDLMRQLRQQYDLPSIAITGYALDDQPDSYVAHLMKPGELRAASADDRRTGLVKARRAEKPAPSTRPRDVKRSDLLNR